LEKNKNVTRTNLVLKNKKKKCFSFNNSITFLLVWLRARPSAARIRALSASPRPDMVYNRKMGVIAGAGG